MKESRGVAEPALLDYMRENRQEAKVSSQSFKSSTRELDVDQGLGRWHEDIGI